MGDNDKTTTTTIPQDDPASNAPDAAAADSKGKGKSVEDPATQELSMDEDEESDEGSGPEDIVPDADDEEDDHDNLEPISSENIISGGRRTRGKNIDFAEAAQKAKDDGDDEMDDDDEDEDFSAANEDENMRDN